MTIVNVTFGIPPTGIVFNGPLGFTGTSCADFARAMTTLRWDLGGTVDDWTAITCSSDMLPKTNNFTYRWMNTKTGAYEDRVATVTQMDSYRTYRPVTQWEQLLPLDVSDAVALSSAVLLAWATAYAMKLVIRAFSSTSNTGDSNEEDR